jgi:predicted membrane metal-binding protein
MAPLATQYLRWHYTQGVVDLVHIVGNFVWFLYEFFSIRLLFSTLFVPFHRLNEESPTGLDLGRIAEKVIVNTLMRLVGALMRISLILLGLFLICVVVVIGSFFLVVWLCAPFVVLTLVIYGVIRIFV